MQFVTVSRYRCLLKRRWQSRYKSSVGLWAKALENQELKKAGLKVTSPRVKILGVIESAQQNHLSAEDVYKMLIDQSEDIGIATVYRVLTQFEEAGILVKHNFDDGRSVFELSSDDHHDHMVCQRCGKVEEFFDAKIEALQEKIAEKYQFKILHHSHSIYGLCKDCIS
jgi:Fur family ferric uptake transcriptional regulator